MVQLQVHLLNVVPIVAWLTEAQQYLAQVQSRLDRHLEAWATLRQAIDILRSPALAQIVESLDSAQNTARQVFVSGQLLLPASYKMHEERHMRVSMLCVGLSSMSS